MAHSNNTQSASFVEVPLSFRRGEGWRTQLVKIRDQGSRQANNDAAIQRAVELGYNASEVEPFLTGE